LSIIHGKTNNNPYRVSVLKMKSFQTQAHWLLVSPKQTPTSLKILCQMAPTKKKCQKGTPPPGGGGGCLFGLF
jgi:hypothetical protein